MKGGSVLGAIGAGLMMMGGAALKSCEHAHIRPAAVVEELAPTVRRSAEPAESAFAGAAWNAGANAGESQAGNASRKLADPPVHGAPLADDVFGKSRRDISKTLKLELPTSASGADEWKPLAGETILRSEVRNVHSFAIDAPIVRPPRLLAAFPTNDGEYRAVYARTPSAGAMTEVRQLATRAQGISRAITWSSPPPPKANLRAALKSFDDTDVVVIISHAEDQGTTVVLPSGERLSHTQVHEVCAETEIRCIVLSCHSKDLQLDSEISARDALSVWAVANSSWSKADRPVDLPGYIGLFRKANSQVALRKNITLTAMVGGGGAVGTAYIVTSQQTK